MIPSAIRVFPLGRIKEPAAFGTRERAFGYFCHELKSRENPPGRFNLPAEGKFKKDSLVLFQYTEREGREEIIAHALLVSDGFILSGEVNNYIGYYQFDVNSINFYNTPVTKDEIFNIWHRDLYQRSKLLLDVAKYDDYMELLKSKNNIRSKCL